MTKGKEPAQTYVVEFLAYVTPQDWEKRRCRATLEYSKPLDEWTLADYEAVEKYIRLRRPECRGIDIIRATPALCVPEARNSNAKADE